MHIFRNNMLKFSFWFLLGLLLLLSCMISDGALFVILGGLLLLINILLVVLEKSRITKSIKHSLEKKNYTEVIETIKKIYPKLYFEKNKKLCLTMLVELYMVNDEAIKAKSILEHNPFLQNVKNLYHIQLILALAEGDNNKKAKVLYKIFMIDKASYKNYKESVKELIRMVETEEFNEELYQNSKYPLLKRICSKYSDNPEEVDNLDLGEVTVNDYFKVGNKKQKILKIFLNILTILSFFISMVLMIMIFANNISSITPIIFQELIYIYVKYYWVILLFLIISLTNIIVSIYFKSKNIKYLSNFTIGIIVSVILLFLGLIHLTVYNTFYTHNSYLHTHSYSIEMPDDYTLVKSQIQTSEITQNYIITVKSVTVVRCKDKDYRFFYKEDWVPYLSGQEWIPSVVKLETVDFDYFKRYNVSTGKYNSFNYENGNDYIQYAYDIETNVLVIYNFHVEELENDSEYL